LLFDERLHVGFFGVHLPFVAAKTEDARAGRPETATRNAWRTMSGKRSTASTRGVELGHGLKAGTSSTSW